MREDILLSGPVAFLAEEMGITLSERLLAYQAWWETEGWPIALAIDSLGTPHLRQFSAQGERIDEIGYPPSYLYLLSAGYSAGIVAEVADRHDLRLSYALGFITSYYDPGLYCPYTVSLSTWVLLYKYFTGRHREAFLQLLARREAPFGQGATWMTEIGSGSDLGATVHTSARRISEELWHLEGEKYFASNVGADIAVVAARPEGSVPGIKGIALFAVPRERTRGGRNYLIRRLKNKIGTHSVPTGEVELRQAEAYLIGEAHHGIYYLLEVLNFSRVANAVAVVAHALHALTQAYRFAQQRRVFGQFLVEQPLFRAEAERHYQRLRWAGALAWLSEQWLETVWLEKPPYSQRYAVFRLLTHLAKFWTAQVGLEVAQWGVEVWGGLGILGEFPAERFVRELMVTNIWEGTRHRHLLDGWEVLQRYNLLEILPTLWDVRGVDPTLLEGLGTALQKPLEEVASQIEPLLGRLAQAIGQITAEQRTYSVLA